MTTLKIGMYEVKDHLHRLPALYVVGAQLDMYLSLFGYCGLAFVCYFDIVRATIDCHELFADCIRGGVSASNRRRIGPRLKGRACAF